jgi:spermidine/putrescine transport system ATP-binding protein
MSKRVGDGAIELVGLRKRFGDVTAVDGIDVGIRGGEFFSLLGPSGCGKTTTLRLIAGFERPDEGRILLDGVDMAATPPHRRRVNTVFQSYALFPHLDVFGNVAFGLRRQREGRKEIRARVGAVLEAVRLGGYEQRRPSQLSGGQQQRVALARALVLNPSVLLLDEPLGALDAKLRKALQLELKSIQEQFGITFVYVTHDQEEALTMSDRIAVMSDGHVEQIATPAEMYEEPQTVFVADFLGISNLMKVTVEGLDADSCRTRLGDFVLRAAKGDRAMHGETRVVIRPERVRVEPYESSGENRVPGMVERVVYLGSARQLVVRLATGDVVQALVVNDGTQREVAQGTAVQAHLPAEALRVLAPSAPPVRPAEPEALAPAADAAVDALGAGPRLPAAPCRGEATSARSSPPTSGSSASGAP